MTTMMIADNRNPKPWYREPWPWFLMSGPFLVIVAALVSAWVAVSTNDGLVADDYYKQGLVAGETLAKSQKAQELGLSVSLRLTSDSIRITLKSREVGMVPPATLLISMSHPTRAGIDQKLVLKRNGDAYMGDANLPASGHWLIVVEDDAKTWRLMGSVMLPTTNETTIGEGSPSAKPLS
jgi:uncharacterized protein